MHGVKRLFAWMIPRFDRDALQRLADQPAEEGPVGRHARAARHRRHLPAPVQVRSRDAAGAAEGARPQAGRHRCTCTATARRRSGGWPRRDGRLPAILHEHANLDRHAVVPEDRRSAARAAHRHRDRRVGVDRRVRRSRARLMPAGAHEGRVPRRSARRVQPAAKRGRDGRRAARRSASRRARSPIGTITRLMPSKGNEYLVEAAPTRRRAASRTSAFYIVGEGELQARARGAGARARPRRRLRVHRVPARRRGGAVGVRHRACFRRCGKGRR